MGLLDDAIREHLELKRKRGGDPSEIQRLEQEALAPVPRTRDHADDPDAAVPPPEDVPVPVADPGLEREPLLAPEPEPEIAAEVEPEPEPEPEPVAEAPAVEPLPDHLAQPTMEFSVEEHLAGSETEIAPDPDVVVPDDEAEDVLEETPDFLQETPEHDRLWFEQKPPRDFDFDG